MPAINTAIVARDTIHQLARRENWAQKEAGVVVVFAIVFVVGVGLLSLFISRLIKKRKAKKAGVGA
ncbi:hypothetical protein EV127DRAFT_481464 [Xylaria flabelliformis]|nr:hypothetical protein EV127DRAFT_481464 [Xylaria flabelliformis]KAI0554578.1 hypothetical protein F4679DRAFT_579603 [Xylaria curta]KAI0858620.1 hypothetical protein F4860DRAFT_293694 [Xylaria cubensis]KAI1751299.1 hypothetical protein F4782DRAFT_188997 [Xylaria castorea]